MILEIRRINEGDSELILEWRNHNSVQQNSFNNKLIAMEEHRKWFDIKLKDNNCFMYMVENEKLPCAIVRYDVCLEKKEAVVSITVAPTFQGRGIGAKALDVTEENLHKVTNVDKIIAKVYSDNIPSLKIFKKSNYVEKYLTLEKRTK